jgi:two-component system response regulator PfeR
MLASFSTTARILVIEDDPLLCAHLQTHLQANGCEVVAHLDGRAGLQAAQTGKFDLVLLDVLLPGCNGLDLLEALRREHAVPVIIMSALGSGPDRIAGFRQGADDYLPKPFSMKEMEVRIEAVLRRVAYERKEPTLPPANHLELHFDESRQDASYANRWVELTASEYRLLRALSQHMEEPLSKAFLCQHALRRPSAQSGRSLDMHISHVRRKLQKVGYTDSRLETVWGKGYVMARGES